MKRSSYESALDFDMLNLIAEARMNSVRATNERDQLKRLSKSGAPEEFKSTREIRIMEETIIERERKAKQTCEEPPCKVGDAGQAFGADEAYDASLTAFSTMAKDTTQGLVAVVSKILRAHLLLVLRV